jgi:hypothetical protein
MGKFVVAGVLKKQSQFDGGQLGVKSYLKGDCAKITPFQA